MPQKDPSNWALVADYIQNKWAVYGALITGVAIAFFASCLNYFLWGKQDRPKKVLAEASLCSIIVYAVHPLLIYVGLNQELIIPIGTAVGLTGTSYIRQLLLKFMQRPLNLPKTKDFDNE